MNESRFQHQKQILQRSIYVSHSCSGRDAEQRQFNTFRHRLRNKWAIKLKLLGFQTHSASSRFRRTETIAINPTRHFHNVLDARLVYGVSCTIQSQNEKIIIECCSSWNYKNKQQSLIETELRHSIAR